MAICFTGDRLIQRSEIKVQYICTIIRTSLIPFRVWNRNLINLCNSRRMGESREGLFGTH